MTQHELWFLQGGGVSGQTARDVDWSATPVGPPESWPTVLKSTLATMFRARQPMFLWWGRELVQFYNDAYLPSFGEGKHPRAMGQRGAECWQEIWPIIFPQIDDVMSRARGSWNEDALVPIFRNGRLEEVYWTYSYTPVFGESGEVAGTLVICTETTNRVIGERRTRTLHDIVEASSNATDVVQLEEEIFQILNHAQHDTPFAVLCELGETGQLMRVIRSVGLSERKSTELLADAGSRFVGREDKGVPWKIPTDIAQELDERGRGPQQFFVAPCPADEGSAPNLLLFGLNPALDFDGKYRRFVEQIATHLGAAKSRILETSRRAAIERERQNLLERAPFATAVMLGDRHVFASANAKYMEIVGRRNLVGRAYLDVFPELAGSEVYEQLRTVYTTGKAVVHNEFLISLDRGTGTLENCYFNFTLEPIVDAQDRGAGMMVVAVDITEQVMSRRTLESAHQEREELLASLEEASRAKDEFIAILGHELRNPLAPIMTALRLLQEKEGDSTVREREVIQRQVTHLIRLVDDLLDVSKIARGKVDLRTELVDLREIARRAVEMVSDLFEARKHHLSLEIGEEKLTCYGDPIRLAQVVTNLLTNAARYTAPEGHIGLALTRQGEEIVLTVVDNGIGMTDEMLPLVFDLFKQAARSSDREEGGLGIGLTLVESLVRLHGGSVAAHSEGHGTGSTFTVRLPAAIGEQTIGQPQVERTQTSHSPKRVLVVDDNADAVELLGEVLSRKGHEVVSATEPLEALDLAEEFRPECAILDIGLPVIDGYELAMRLRRVHGCAGCRLIALSGYGSQEDRRRGERAGFDEHLVKPVDFERLLNLLDEPSNSFQ